MSLFRTFAPLRSLVARPQHQLARVAAVSGASQRWTSGLAAGAETEEGEFAPVAEVTFESSEPTFMTTLTFSEKGVQAMLMEDVDREKVRDTHTCTHVHTHSTPDETCSTIPTPLQKQT